MLVVTVAVFFEAWLNNFLLLDELPILEHMAKLKQNSEKSKKKGEENFGNSEEQKKRQVRKTSEYCESIDWSICTKGKKFCARMSSHFWGGFAHPRKG